MTFDIRIATERELPAVLALYAQLELDTDRCLSIEEARRLLQRIHANPDHRIYVALEDGAVVGTFALLIMRNLAHLGKPSGILEDIVVDQHARGKGIGKRMLQFALEHCRAQGCYKLALSSNLARRQAHAFYEALGFKQHGYSFSLEV